MLSEMMFQNFVEKQCVIAIFSKKKQGGDD